MHEKIKDEAFSGNIYTMQELTAKENSRIERVIKAANLEKEAIVAFRKAHKKNPIVDLSTKAKIEEVDRRYTEAIEKNDLETARYLVEQMALLKGYSVTDFRIDHQAPYKNGYDSRLDDVSPKFGEDIYGKNAERYFGTYEGFDNESIYHIQAVRNKPDSYVTIYRAVPVSVKGNQIRNGDWITLTRRYAEQHGKSNIIGNYRVISKRVQAKNIYTDGNSIHEFGYDDGNNYYYRDTTNYRKLADVITFDDQGNPIRLKDRFNYRNSDVRYALPDVDSDGRQLSNEQRQFFNNSKIRVSEQNGWAKTISPDGKLMPVYHGTNSGEFTIFDKDVIGSANDGGWFGQGFYFAFDSYEASMYGGRVLECYLNVENPFFFAEEMKAYDGVEHGDVYFDIA